MAFFSRVSAKELADKIHDARQDKANFLLEIVWIAPGEEWDGGAYLVREVRSAEQMADGREMVHCETVTVHRPITIIFPAPAEQAIGIAEILISSD